MNYRVYDKTEIKTKNDYFLDMLAQVLEWGLKPDFMTGDSWYSCVNNLKTVKNHRMGFLFAIESNRRVSLEKGSWVQGAKIVLSLRALIQSNGRWQQFWDKIDQFGTQVWG